MEAGQIARNDVLGKCKDVGEAQAEHLGDAAQLVGSGRSEQTLLETHDRRVVHVGLFCESPGREAKLFAARAQSAAEFLGSL